MSDAPVAVHSCVMCQRLLTQTPAEYVIVWGAADGSGEGSAELYLCAEHYPACRAELDAYNAAYAELEAANVSPRMMRRIIAQRVQRRELLPTLLED
jgi:hypothetical protein